MNCEYRDPCAEPHHCGVNGQCVSKDFCDYKCHCKKGYTGDTCSIDINECDSYDSPMCDNGGTCINTVNNWILQIEFFTKNHN